MAGGGRSFRRRCARFWKLWPLPPLIDEMHRVVYVDGIYLGRSCVILIARSEYYILGWYVAKSENSHAWRALLSRIAPPEVVVCDGGCGFENARQIVWPRTKVQRCTYHVFCQIKRETTSRPRLQAGVELYTLAKELLRIKDGDRAVTWLQDYNQWCFFWEDFLKEKTTIDGRQEFTHKNLRKARKGLNRLIRQDVLFTYLNPSLTREGPLPATNNKMEGAVMAQLRHMLRDHRGLSLTRRIKACFWWCYLHTECPLSSAEILKSMPTDDDVDNLFRIADVKREWRESLPGLGVGIVWDDLHLSGSGRLEWN